MLSAPEFHSHSLIGVPYVAVISDAAVMLPNLLGRKT